MKCTWRLVLAVFLFSAFGVVGAVPDLTRGDKPTPMKKSTKLLIGNLGPTGLKRWVYTQGLSTSQSRQILVTEVAPGYLDTHELKRDRFGLNALTLLAFNDDRIPGNAARQLRAGRICV